MIRTQIQLTEEQAKTLKKIASRRGKSVAELIRISVDEWIRSSAFVDPDEQPGDAALVEVCGKIAWILGRAVTEYGDRLQERVPHGLRQKF